MSVAGMRQRQNLHAGRMVAGRRFLSQSPARTQNNGVQEWPLLPAQETIMPHPPPASSPLVHPACPPPTHTQAHVLLPSRSVQPFFRKPSHLTSLTHHHHHPTHREVGSGGRNEQEGRKNMGIHIWAGRRRREWNNGSVW